MTFEERLDEFAKGQQELQDGQKRLNNSLDHLVEVQAKNESTITRILEALAKDGDHIRALTRIADIHERRLTELE